MSEREPTEGIFRVGALTKGPLRIEHFARISFIKVETAAKPSRFRLLTYKAVYWEIFPDDIVKITQFHPYRVNGVGDEDSFSFFVSNEFITDYDLEELCIDHFLNDVLLGKPTEKYDSLMNHLTYRQRTKKRWKLSVSMGRPDIFIKTPLHTHTLQSYQGQPLKSIGSVVTLMTSDSTENLEKETTSHRKSYNVPYEDGDWFNVALTQLAMPVNVVSCKMYLTDAPKPKKTRYLRKRK